MLGVARGSSEASGATPRELAIRLWSFCPRSLAITCAWQTLSWKFLLTLRWPSLTPSASLMRRAMLDKTKSDRGGKVTYRSDSVMSSIVSHVSNP